MRTYEKKLNQLNEMIYNNLEGILKRLNKRIHIKLYALIYGKEHNLVGTIRVKKTVNKEGNPSSVSQDVLKKLTDVYAELKIAPNYGKDTYENIKKYMDWTWYKEHLQTYQSDDEQSTISPPVIEGGYAENEESHLNGTRILYANQIPFQAGKNLHSVVYIIEIRNIEHEVLEYFYKKPEISFLRMLLDYFFSDFFDFPDNRIGMNKDMKIARKYNEDGVQFNRRITRLFFGKMQNDLLVDTRFDLLGGDFEHGLNNQYYVNGLLEKIDDISALTYENASPFGSILFMNRDVIAQQSIIHFTIKFTPGDRIQLDDAKRIRKLLELTNIDQDLYLISDGYEIFGLGEVNWNVQKDALTLRLDFTGLSKYNLVLVRAEPGSSSGGELLIEDERKLFRSYFSLIETNLISVTFKNPLLGEEGYSPEKFKNILINIFWENEENNVQITEKIKRLEQIVRKAREQKQGTMVVITEPLTAEQEMEQLSKQSTLIEPTIINPDYIKYLTEIDGAIYFDSNGYCHAIGVILDGVAKEAIGDASRGARYNSAYRYLHKLKDDEQKKCVIVIISEDGMVDLIPELENEDMLLTIAEEIIDMINEENPDGNKLGEKEKILLQSKIVDCDWLFNIAEVHKENDNIEKAIAFYESGFKRGAGSYIPAKHYNRLGICYRSNKEYEKAIDMYKLAIESSDNEQSKVIYLGNAGISCFTHANELKDGEKEFREAIDWFTQSIELAINHSIKLSAETYNLRGRCYWELSKLEKGKEEKIQFLKDVIADYSQAIQIAPENNIYYQNRSMGYKALDQLKPYIEDLIRAESIKHEDRYIKALTQLFENNISLVSESFEFYNKWLEQNEESPELMALFSTFNKKAKVSSQDEVAAGIEDDTNKD